MKKRRKVTKVVPAPGQHWELDSVLYVVRKVTDSNVVILSEVASDKDPLDFNGTKLTRVRHVSIKVFGTATRHIGELGDWIRKKNGDEAC